MIRFPTRRTLLTTVLSMTAGCGAPCSNRVVESSSSPGNELRAVVFERDCGPAVAKQVHLSIIPVRSSDPNGGGNALVVEPAASGALPHLGLEWIGRNRLKVSYTAGVRVVKSVRSAAAVEIDYVPVVEPGPNAPIGEP